MSITWPDVSSSTTQKANFMDFKMRDWTRWIELM